MMLEFIAVHREDIIRRCRMKISMRLVPPPTEAELDHGVPLFLEQLVDALRLGPSSIAAIRGTALLHGHDFTVAQVVRDYGDVCQSITELAVELNAPIAAGDLRTLNRCLDDAIAGAIIEHGHKRVQSGCDGEAARGSERLGFLAHELRNLTNTAIVAFESLTTGNVGISGSTGTVLHRSLMGIRTLVGRSISEVPLTQRINSPERFFVWSFVDELTPEGAAAANAAGVTLTVLPIDDGLVIEADRLVLKAVVMNLLQNAFKFTRPGTMVTLRVAASAERVLIEVQDECGGLPRGNVEDLFRPFAPSHPDRTGIALGLSFSRWAVEANHGSIYARDVSGVGCVFTLDLPRLPLSTLSIA
jgi:signal transduction histidine kinase